MKKIVVKKIIVLCLTFATINSLVSKSEIDDSIISSIAIVDIDEVVNKSLYGKSIQAEIDKEQKEYQKALQQKEDEIKHLDTTYKSNSAELSSAKTKLQIIESSDKNSITPEKMAENNQKKIDIIQTIKTLSEEIEFIANKINNRQNELQVMMRRVEEYLQSMKFSQQKFIMGMITQTANDYIKENNKIHFILNSYAVIASKKNKDITDIIIQRLDQQKIAEDKKREDKKKISN